MSPRASPSWRALPDRMPSAAPGSAAFTVATIIAPPRTCCGALGIRDISPGTLLIIDEASMMSLPDLAEIIAHATRRGAKVIIAGDCEQLAAVESGGGLTLLARRLGYVQLAEAVRFTAQWERDASLRLRAGDVTALDDYHQHGRIRGAVPEQAMDDAVRTYVAHYLAGDDVLLMINDRERCREAARRIRDNLIHLGIVSTGCEIKLADGARASAGDFIICRRNNRRLEAGTPDRTLANGDTLRIEAIGRRHITVRRALDCDPATGARRWSQPFAYAGYRADDLAYAVTGHSAQGRTVKAGIAVLTGGEDRHWLYVAMTRGREQNDMIAFTRSPRLADPEAGTRPAPEIARHERSQRERAGLPAAPVPAGGSPEPRDAIAAAAGILGQKDPRESALETRARSLSNADHLGVLHAIWQEETRAIQAAAADSSTSGSAPATRASPRSGPRPKKTSPAGEASARSPNGTASWRGRGRRWKRSTASRKPNLCRPCKCAGNGTSHRAHPAPLPGCRLRATPPPPAAAVRAAQVSRAHGEPGPARPARPDARAEGLRAARLDRRTR